MFRCELTGKLTKPGEKMKKIVVQTRERVYLDEDGLETGRGTEIVKEISVSEEAYIDYLREHPELEPAPKKKKPTYTFAPLPASVENQLIEDDEHDVFDDDV